jgi:hypothetical protein
MAAERPLETQSWREKVREMRRAGILALALLILAACAPEESSDTPRPPEGSRGKTIVFESNERPHVLALFLDEGSQSFYGDVSEVGGPSDLGGDLGPCGEGISECVEFGGIYLMVPPPGGADWVYSGYDFHVVARSSEREGHVVVVSLAGDERYSYGFSPRCGVEWINLSTGGERGERVYYAVDRSLFSEVDCTSAPTG